MFKPGESKKLPANYRKSVGVFLWTIKKIFYETYIPQTNLRNPNPWQSTGRFDGIGDKHWNKALQKDIYAPHVHDPLFPGRVRYPYHWEFPK